MATKKSLLFIPIYIAILAAVWFGNDMVRFLRNDEEIAAPFPLEEKEEIITSVSEEEIREDKSDASGKSVEGVQSPQVGAVMPVYGGRDPQEVRPDPEEVLNFSEEQKQKIYDGINDYGQAVKRDPDFFFGWIQAGLLKKVIGDFEGARDAWEYMSIIRPLNSISFANLGELYWRYLPDYPKSEANFQIAIKNKPDDVQSYISLSDLYFYSYKEKEHLADDILLEGLKANPDDPTLMKMLAYFYERQGRHADAITWWQNVLEREPDNKEVAAAIEALKKKQ